MRASRFVPLLAGAALVSALPAFSQTDFQYQPYATPGNNGVALAAPFSHVFDFNGDGYADVLAVSTTTCTGSTCNATSSLYLYMNDGSGSLKSPVKLAATPMGGSFLDVEQQVVVSDFNGDGKLDIAVLGYGSITMLYGNGDGTFQAPVTINLPETGSDAYNSLVEADFDVNNTQDLAALTYGGNLVMLFNDGKGNFTEKTVALDTTAAGAQTTSLTVGDFNGDGRPDVAWVEQNYASGSTDYIESATNTGAGVFSAKHQAGGLEGTSYNLAYVTSADLDLDGKSDLIAWTTQIIEDCCSSMPVMLYYSNGNNTFTSSTLTSASGANSVGVTDINGDGNRDILLAENSGVAVFAGNGNRTFTNQGTYTSLPGGALQLGFGFFTGSDAMGFADPNSQSDSGIPNDFYVVANDNPQGECAYPTHPGVAFCGGTRTGNLTEVKGSGRAAVEPVRRIELWVGGKKVYQVLSDEFDARLNIAPGEVVTAEVVGANGATVGGEPPSMGATPPAAPASMCARPPRERLLPRRSRSRPQRQAPAAP